MRLHHAGSQLPRAENLSYVSRLHESERRLVSEPPLFFVYALEENQVVTSQTEAEEKGRKGDLSEVWFGGSQPGMSVSVASSLLFRDSSQALTQSSRCGPGTR